MRGIRRFSGSHTLTLHGRIVATINKSEGAQSEGFANHVLDAEEDGVQGGL